MKRIITIAVWMFSLSYGRAQGIGSFFNQSDTKTKTMLQQIALQETYLSEIKKGYQTTENGLNTAHDLKNGTFNLHQSYFNSLGRVSPAVVNNPKIKLVSTYQQQIISGFDNEISWQKQQSILAADEMSYILAVYSNLLAECKKDIDELNMVITPGQAQMKDAERIKHIDAVYTATNDKYKFAQSFIANSHAFALDRQNSSQQTQVLKKLYNIN
jgi:hypothetical protein